MGKKRREEEKLENKKTNKRKRGEKLFSCFLNHQIMYRSTIVTVLRISIEFILLTILI
jgi:hypothetical protein